VAARIPASEQGTYFRLLSLAALRRKSARNHFADRGSDRRTSFAINVIDGARCFDRVPSPPLLCSI
jgi:hypothetical protein